MQTKDFNTPPTQPGATCPNKKQVTGFIKSRRVRTNVNERCEYFSKPFKEIHTFLFVVFDERSQAIPA